MRNLSPIAIFVIVLLHYVAVATCGEVTVGGLRCEYMVNPLGIEAKTPRLNWTIDSTQRGQRQTAYQILVASSNELLAHDRGDLWDSGKVESDESIQVPYAGMPLQSRMQCFWKVRVWDKAKVPCRWSQSACWTMGLLKCDDWIAKWIGMDPVDGNAEYPRFRKTFVLDQPPKDARVYVSSLGYHELFINGKKVGEGVLSPAVTQLDRRSLYLTHDVASLLHKGTNCIALGLGRGWYVTVGRDSGVDKRVGYADILHPGGPVALAQLEIVTDDGKTTVVATDKSWKASSSPFSRTSDSWSPASTATWWAWSLRYDARREQAGWDTLDYDDHQWTHARECDFHGIATTSQRVEPNRIVRTYAPVSIQKHGTDICLIDMGSNLSGWLKLHVRGAYRPGHKIRVDYGDHLDEKGEPVGAGDFDELITAGHDDAWFCCPFTYHGFRYAKVTGLLTPPHKEDVVGCLIRTGYPRSGSFACSNQRLTAIHDLVAHTLECLTLSGYMVDCPHYERMGYGDGQHTVEGAMMMFDMGPLHRSWHTVWRDCQLPNGDMPYTAPSYRAGGGPSWCGQILVGSWYVYLQNGDRVLLEENYSSMQNWLRYFDSFCTKDGLFETWSNTDRRNWCLGDWAVPKGVDQAYPPSVKLVNNCYRVYCFDLMSQIAAAIDKPADAARYREKAEMLRPVVHRAFYNPRTKTYAAGSQLDLAFPLLTNVVPQELRADIARQLDRNILEKSDGHVGVGDVGIIILTKALMNIGRNDLIFSYTNKDTYPSWGDMLKNDATAVWEYWENDQRSHIHNCYNAIGMWFYQGLAGIQPDPAAPGFRHFIVKPSIVGDVTWAKATYQSVRGPIVVDWNLKDEQLRINVQVPANSKATIFVPTDKIARVTESGVAAEKSEGVVFRRMEGSAAVFDIDSGDYCFVVRRSGI